MSAVRFAAALAAAALAISAPAFASVQSEEASSGPVQWADIDITTPEGAAELDARINASARRACRGMRSTGSNMSQTAFCRTAIRDSVLQRMDEPTREAYNRARAESRRGGRN